MRYALSAQPPRTRPFAMSVLLRKEIAARLSSIWFFLLTSAACLIATTYGAGFQSGFETEKVLVTANPLAILNAIVSIFLAVIMGTRLAGSMAWEREHGTLEVLLISPAGPRSIVVAKFVAEFGVLCLLLAIYGAFLLVGQPLGAGVVRIDDIAALANHVALVLPVIALGLFVSGFFSGVRGAVIAYLVILACLAAFEGALSMLQVAEPQDLGLAVLYLRAGMEWADRVLGVVSWVAPIADLVRSVLHQAVIGTAEILHAIVITALTIALSAETLRVRGAA